MLEALLSGGLGTLLGGVTGLIGTYLNNKKELKIAELEADERKDKRAHEVLMMDKTHQYTLETAKLKNEHEREISADNRMMSSYQFASRDSDDTNHRNRFIAFLFGMVEVGRRLVRVVASFGSMAILAYMTYFIYNNLDKFLVTLQTINDGKEAFTLMQYLIFTVCYVSTTVILWWFGGRTKRPPSIS
ncbi:hypothetical protein ACRXCV_00475 (plasmid) [Halobacteriovorax sp. GFR7]|uniref:hypothetical protein n=1 Tax=unclassified Halobacteriovorax TaxID=2639665 RepID=UPI003D9581E0